MNEYIHEYKWPKEPKSERACHCGALVKASGFARMAGGYQAWGWCTCGTTHAFDEWIKEMKI